MVVAVWPLAACSTGYWLESESSNRQTPSCHRERHPSHGAAGPIGSGRDPGPHPRQPSGPRRRNRLVKPAGVRMGTTVTSGLSALPPSATSCGGVGAKQLWTRRWASHSPWCWSAIATLPATITTALSTTALSSGAGRICCGTSTTSEPSTPKTPHWPDGRRPSTNSMSGPKPSAITSHGKGVLPNLPCNGNCWPSVAALSWLTRQLSKAGCAGALSATSKACPVLDTGNSWSSWPNRGRARGQQPGRAQPAPSGHQPQGQRRHPLRAGHREQDDAGIPLRHLARPRSKSSRRLPSAAHFPSTLNCYGHGSIL